MEVGVKLNAERDAKMKELEEYIWKEGGGAYRGGSRTGRGGSGGRGRGGYYMQAARAESSSNARYNASFAALVDNAPALAGTGEADSSRGHPSLRRERSWREAEEIIEINCRR